MPTPMPMPPVCLSISASDCSGSSLASADMKTFTALGTYGTSVLTGVVARSFSSTWDVQAFSDSLVRDQLEAVLDSLPVVAVKVGVCPSVGTIRVIGRWLREHPNLPCIIDPVFKEQPGIPTAAPEVISAMQEELLPRATIATPNRFEAAQLTGMEEVLTREDMEDAARRIFTSCGSPTIVTGGGFADESQDVYVGLDGVSHFSAPAIKRAGRVIGAGCTYAAAITAQLARGEGLRESIWAAKDYVGKLIEAAPPAIDDGLTPLCHCQATDNLAQGEGIGVSTGSFARIETPASGTPKLDS